MSFCYGIASLAFPVPQGIGLQLCKHAAPTHSLCGLIHRCIFVEYLISAIFCITVICDGYLNFTDKLREYDIFSHGESKILSLPWHVWLNFFACMICDHEIGSDTKLWTLISDGVHFNEYLILPPITTHVELCQLNVRGNFASLEIFFDALAGLNPIFLLVKTNIIWHQVQDGWIKEKKRIYFPFTEPLSGLA